MKRLVMFVLTLFCLWSSTAIACGPTPQKVVESIEIQASAAHVISVLQASNYISQWHPLVQQAQVKEVLSVKDQSESGTYREIVFHNGWRLRELLKEPTRTDVLEDSRMSGGNFPISQYRGVLEIRASDKPGTVIVVWSARFNNQANLLDAPVGQDNATAIAAVTNFYHQGLHGLKQFVETHAMQYSYNTKENQ